MNKVWKNGKGLEEWKRFGRMGKTWKDGEGLEGWRRIGWTGKSWKNGEGFGRTEKVLKDADGVEKC